MDSFRIGYIDGPWVNFEPPISGGVFRAYEGEANMRKCAKTITTTHCPSKTTALPGADGVCNKKASPPATQENLVLSNIQDKLDVNELVTSTLDKFPRSCTQVEFMDLAEQLEIDSDIGRFPSVDPATQRTIINRYRQLHQKVADDGHYECRYLEYGKESVRYLTLFVLSMTALKYEWYMTSAMLLGLFWHQIMFSAHDAGHLAITHNYIADTLIGIFIADFCCGLSIGWWKSSHNVHHLVPNHPVSTIVTHIVKQLANHISHRPTIQISRTSPYSPTPPCSSSPSAPPTTTLTLPGTAPVRLPSGSRNTPTTPSWALRASTSTSSRGCT